MRLRLFFASASVLLALAGPAWARGTLDSILPQIRAEHPGQLSDAQPWTDSTGRTHYKIKWLTPEGRVLYFNADADSGRYSNSNGEDGGQWRGDRSRGDDSSPSDEDRGSRHRDHWNGGDDGDSNTDRGGDWHDRHGDGDSGQGDWHRGGDQNGGRGDWRGGRNGGDNGGGGHHHHGDY